MIALSGLELRIRGDPGILGIPGRVLADVPGGIVDLDRRELGDFALEDLLLLAHTQT